MLIKCLPVGHLMTNCYIVTDETTLETERRFNPYLTALQNRGQ